MNAALFDLSGHGFFVWSSYGAFFLAIALELYAVKRKRQAAKTLAQQMVQEKLSGSTTSASRTKVEVT